MSVIYYYFNMRQDVIDRKSDIIVWVDKDIPKIEIARRLDCSPMTIDRYLKKWGIEYSGNKGGRGIRDPHRKTSLELIDSINSGKNINNSILRDRLIDDGIKEYKCEWCNATEWMGKPISLELHHKNFKHYDNNLDNLLILCPNCHSFAHKYKCTCGVILAGASV